MTSKISITKLSGGTVRIERMLKNGYSFADYYDTQRCIIEDEDENRVAVMIKRKPLSNIPANKIPYTAEEAVISLPGDKFYYSINEIIGEI